MKFLFLLIILINIGFAIDAHKPKIIWEKSIPVNNLITKSTHKMTQKMYQYNNRLFFVYNGEYVNKKYKIDAANIFSTDLKGGNVFYYQVFKNDLTKYDDNYYINDIKFEDDYFNVILKTKIAQVQAYLPQYLKFVYNQESPIERIPEAYDGSSFKIGYTLSDIFFHNNNIVYFEDTYTGENKFSFKDLFEISCDLKDTINDYNLKSIDDIFNCGDNPLEGVLYYNENEFIASFKNQTIGLSYDSTECILVKYNLQNTPADIDWYAKSFGEFGALWKTEGYFKYNMLTYFAYTDIYNTYTNYLFHTKISDNGDFKTDTVYSCYDATEGKTIEINGVKLSKDNDYYYLYGTKDFYWTGSGEREKFFILIFDKNMSLVEEILWNYNPKSYLTDILIKENGNLIVYGYSGYYDYEPYIAEIQPDIASSVIIKKQNISISPNPAEDYIEISMNHSSKGLEQTEGSDIEIYDVLGNRVFYSTPSLLRNAIPCSHPDLSGQEGNFKIDVSHLSKGVYFLKIGDRVEKFIKM